MRSKMLLSAGALLALGWACSHDFENPYDPEYNAVPEIRLSIFPNPADTTRMTVFDASGTIDDDGTGFQMRLLRMNGPDPGRELFGWIWADRFEYKFEQTGTYELRLELKDDKGALVTQDRTLQVNGAPAPNIPPFAGLTVNPPHGTRPQNFEFDAQVRSADADGPASSLIYRWQYVNVDSLGFSAWEGNTSGIWSHIFSAPSVKEVHLWVIDGAGDSAYTVVSIPVRLVVGSPNLPPAANIKLHNSYKQAVNGIFSVTAEVSDFEGDYVEVGWDINGDDTPEIGWQGGRDASISFPSSGTKRIRLLARDPSGSNRIVHAQIQVVVTD